MVDRGANRRQVGVKLYFRNGTNLPEDRRIPGGQYSEKERRDQTIPVIMARGAAIDLRRYQVRLSSNGSKRDFYYYELLKITDLYGRNIWRNPRYCPRCFANTGTKLRRRQRVPGGPRYRCGCGVTW